MYQHGIKSWIAARTAVQRPVRIEARKGIQQSAITIEQINVHSVYLELFMDLNFLLFWRTRLSLLTELKAFNEVSLVGPEPRTKALSNVVDFNLRRRIKGVGFTKWARICYRISTEARFHQFSLNRHLAATGCMASDNSKTMCDDTINVFFAVLIFLFL